MHRDVMWRALRWPGLEHLAIRATPAGVVADALIVVQMDHRPLRIAYRIGCDAGWKTRQVRVELLGEDTAKVLESDGAGQWRDGAGRSLPALAGALDVDLSVTPFTNTLPIRRLRLRPGYSEELRVAYVEAPDLTVRVAEQRYACLEAGRDTARYRYESARFRAELLVDADGLVTEYPGVWQRADEPIAATS